MDLTRSAELFERIRALCRLVSAFTAEEARGARFGAALGAALEDETLHARAELEEQGYERYRILDHLAPLLHEHWLRAKAGHPVRSSRLAQLVADAEASKRIGEACSWVETMRARAGEEPPVELASRGPEPQA